MEKAQGPRYDASGLFKALRVGVTVAARAVSSAFGIPFAAALFAVAAVIAVALMVYGALPGEAGTSPERAACEAAAGAVSPTGQGPEADHTLPWGAVYGVKVLYPEGDVGEIARALAPEFEYGTVEVVETDIAMTPSGPEEVRRTKRLRVLRKARTYRGVYEYRYSPDGSVEGTDFTPDFSKVEEAIRACGGTPDPDSVMLCVRAAEAVTLGEPYVEWLDDEDLAVRSSVDWESVYCGSPGTLLVPVSGRLSSPFGMRTHPVYGWRSMHSGIDIAAPKGTPVVAAEAGEVRLSGRLKGLGLAVVVDHGGGLFTVYGHCSELFVNAGEEVFRGEKIAEVGSTGISTGPHLHFEVRVNGEPKDPVPFISR